MRRPGGQDVLHPPAEKSLGWGVEGGRASGLVIEDCAVGVEPEVEVGQGAEDCELRVRPPELIVGPLLRADVAGGALHEGDAAGRVRGEGVDYFQPEARPVLARGRHCDDLGRRAGAPVGPWAILEVEDASAEVRIDVELLRCVARERLDRRAHVLERRVRLRPVAEEDGRALAGLGEEAKTLLVSREAVLELAIGLDVPVRDERAQQPAALVAHRPRGRLEPPRGRGVAGFEREAHDRLAAERACEGRLVTLDPLAGEQPCFPPCKHSSRAVFSGEKVAISHPSRLSRRKSCQNSLVCRG